MSDKEKDWILLFVVLAVLIVILPMLMWGLWAGSSMYGMGGMMGYGYGWGFMSLIPFCISGAARAWSVLPPQRVYEHG